MAATREMWKGVALIILALPGLLLLGAGCAHKAAPQAAAKADAPREMPKPASMQAMSDAAMWRPKCVIKKPYNHC